MWYYLLRRILYFVPVLIAISLLAFIISVNAPGDPVERMISSGTSEEGSSLYRSNSELKGYWRKKLGLDLPVFYFSVLSLKEYRKDKDIASVSSAISAYIPVIRFHPVNRYQRWMFGDGHPITAKGAVYSRGIIRGDFGISYQTRQPVTQVIYQRLGWSLFFAVSSLLLAYLISIPLGVWAGANRDSRFDRHSSLVLFLLYSLPSFWVATLLLMTFANPDVLPWFPAAGVKPVTGYPDGAGWLDKVGMSLPYIILPLFCYTYSSLAFLSRTMRVAVADAMDSDYIRTARAKGLPFRLVVFRHAFRNSLLPAITLLANVFPYLLGGSVIIETIFTLPGMGYETIQAVYNQNYPMIVAIFTLTGLLTVLGYLVSDVLYAIADPRIKYHQK